MIALTNTSEPTERRPALAWPIPGSVLVVVSAAAVFWWMLFGPRIDDAASNGRLLGQSVCVAGLRYGASLDGSTPITSWSATYPRAVWLDTERVTAVNVEDGRVVAVGMYSISTDHPGRPFIDRKAVVGKIPVGAR